MQIRYILKEGFSGFDRAKLSMFASVFTVTASLLLLSLFSILLINANSVVESLRQKVEMEAFLDDQITAGQLADTRARIEGLEGVREVRYVSKEEAAAIFKEEFGEDINTVLNFNPLPASFKIALKDGYRTSVKAAMIYNEVKAIKGVDDIIYRKQLLEMIDHRAMMFLWVAFGIGVFIMLSSIVLVANTIRLAIYAKRKIIQTMKLIGATRGFIRTPFLLEGFIQGLLGGLIAAGIIFAVFRLLEGWLSMQLSDFVRVQPWWYAVIVGTGSVLGLLGSMISIRRFIGESVAN